MIELLGDLDKNVDAKTKIKLEKAFESLGNLSQQCAHYLDVLVAEDRDVKRKILEKNIDIQKCSLEVSEASRKKSSLEYERKETQERREKALRTDKIIQYEYERVNSSTWDLKKQVKDVESLNKEIVGSEMGKLRRQIDEVIEEKGTCENQVSNARLLLHSNESYFRKLQAHCHELEKSLDEQINVMEKESSAPKHIRKQIAHIDIAVQNCRAEIEKAKLMANDRQRRILELENKREVTKQLLSQTVNEQHEQSEATLTKQKEVESLENQLGYEKSKSHSLTTTRMDIELNIREVQGELRLNTKTLVVANKKLDVLKRTYVRKKVAMDTMKIAVAQIQLKHQENLHVLHGFEESNVAASQHFDGMKEKIGVEVSKLLQQENVEKEARQRLKSIVGTVGERETRVDKMQAEETKLSKLITIMKGEIEVMKRRSTQIYQAISDLEEEIVMKKCLISNCSKSCDEMQKRYGEFTAFYQKLKSERIGLVKAKNASKTVLSEMTEKIDNLSSQLKNIQNQAMEKVNLFEMEKLSREKNEKSKGRHRREYLMIQKSLRLKQDEFERLKLQIKVSLSVNANIGSGIEQLTNQIDRVERSNTLAIGLMDKRDQEIFQLFQRANLYEEKMKDGHLCLQRKREDLKSLQILQTDTERQIRVAKNNFIDIKQCNAKICSYETELKIQKKLKIDLCKAIEDPSNTNRWRDLKGQDLDNQQLEAKRGILEQNISEYKEMLLERETLLQEISSQTRELRKDQDNSSQKTKEMSRRLNDEHARLRDLTRRMMGLISELSMYQTIATKLENDRDKEHHILHRIKKLIESGQAPNDDTMRELRHIHIKSENKTLLPFKIKAKQTNENNFVPSKLYYQAKYALRTTAEPRPSAYIPENDIALPKPYGLMAPFKPSEYGSTMRHIRHPTVKSNE